MTPFIENTKPVFSTATGRICPDCQQPFHRCDCPENHPNPAISGKIRIRRDKKGRRGKTVTIISGMPLEISDTMKIDAFV